MIGSIMKKIWNRVVLCVVLTFSSAHAASFAPTSVEVLYQPTYTMATGGPTSQLSTLGGGIRIGYAMTPQISFELGGYYDGFVFGGIAGSNQTAYAARATGDFALAVLKPIRIYLGADANAYLSLPPSLTTTGNKDFGLIAGMKLLVGSGPRLVLGAEYRYALATALTYTGGSINASAVVGTVGVHFGLGN